MQVISTEERLNENVFIQRLPKIDCLELGVNGSHVSSQLCEMNVNPIISVSIVTVPKCHDNPS